MKFLLHRWKKYEARKMKRSSFFSLNSWLSSLWALFLLLLRLKVLSKMLSGALELMPFYHPVYFALLLPHILVFGYFQSQRRVYYHLCLLLYGLQMALAILLGQQGLRLHLTLELNFPLVSGGLYLTLQLLLALLLWLRLWLSLSSLFHRLLQNFRPDILRHLARPEHLLRVGPFRHSFSLVQQNIQHHFHLGGPAWQKLGILGAITAGAVGVVIARDGHLTRGHPGSHPSHPGGCENPGILPAEMVWGGKPRLVPPALSLVISMYDAGPFSFSRALGPHKKNLFCSARTRSLKARPPLAEEGGDSSRNALGSFPSG